MATAFTDAATARAPLPFIHPDDMPERYATEGRGTCMVPIVEHGALLVCDKNAAIEPGDAVVMHFTREAARREGMPGMVKRLFLALPPTGMSGLIGVEQLNPPRQYTFATRDVLAVHKVIGFAASDGSGRARYHTNQEAPR